MERSIRTLTGLAAIRNGLRAASKMRIEAVKHKSEPALALDRAGITVFLDTKFLAAGPASEGCRSAAVGFGRQREGSERGFRLGKCILPANEPLSSQGK